MHKSLPDSLQDFLKNSRLAAWLELLPLQLAAVAEHAHGKQDEWQQALSDLPKFEQVAWELTQAQVAVRSAQPVNASQQAKLLQSVQTLIPWRKGPYNLFGLEIDTEWRSDWKWQRVAPHLSNLNGRLVLDVGCGSGYHMWRMLGAGAEAVIGLDPTALFNAQFALFKHYAEQAPLWMLPLKSEDIPDFKQKGFDTVFSMGVLYHRRDPLGHLQELRRALRAGGELVLETLVIEGDQHTALMPEDRYAKMRNVWFIPSIEMLKLWLRRLNFQNIRVVDVNQTSIQEQRCTEWSKGESLVDYLDQANSNLTIEGYPAPLRATLIANTPK